MLRPMVAALMNRGIGYIALRDLLKRVYIEEALRRHADAAQTTDSALSLVTGINRREVKRLRAEVQSPALEHETGIMTGVNMAARVVATWSASPDFRDVTGAPRTLAVHGAEGEDFDTLLRAAKVDVRARTVMSELERAGVVEIQQDGRLRLLRASYTPAEPEEKMLFLAANVGDHLRAAFSNIECTTPSFIERALFHNSISASWLEAMRPHLRRMAEQFLRDANEALLKESVAGTDAFPIAHSEAQKRMRLGVYYYETDADDAP
ncbi:DUF6502 family protein [Acidocella sp. KAb 2-4]|uniref:DUF6502 family protein n=1 Tax=Acidocella sp. KAb 2-4 TaxID=2885158 RepID=UPI001D0871C0|nr:DUF6502 family protein [Acidocella sp. KAb 2-4]MCB5944979.1 DUF6502 family protein [Acidocella sp. KAb 2-4]